MAAAKEQKYTTRGGVPITKRWSASGAVSYFVRTRTPGGARVSATFTREREAESWYRDQKVNQASQSVEQLKRKPLSYHFETLLESKTAQAPGIEGYRRTWELWMAPDLGTIPAAQLEPKRGGVAVLQRYANSLKARAPKGRGTYVYDGVGTLRQVRGLLGSLCKMLYDQEVLDRNPMPAVKWPPMDTKEKRLITAGDVQRYLPKLPWRMRPYVVTAFVLGLRPGEMAGLRVADLDLDEGWVHVRLALKKTGKMDAPKTKAGVRDIPVGPAILEALQRHLDALYPHGPHDGDVVFPNDEGRPYTPAAINMNLFRVGRALGDAKPLTSYLFRHASANYWSNVRPEVVDHLFGHRGRGLRRIGAYGHVRQDELEEIRLMLDQLFVAVLAAAPTLALGPGDAGRTCEVPGCERPYIAKGYCNAHYTRLKNHGDVYADLPLTRKAKGRELSRRRELPSG